MNLHIAFWEYLDLHERCEVGSTRIATREAPYENGAVVPAGDWRPLTPGLAQRLKPTASTPDSSLVELVTLPTDALPQAASDAAISAAAVRPGYSPGRSDSQYLGHLTCPPETLTTTVNPSNRRRIGLHIDNWDRLPRGTRHQSRRRLCLNLGPGHRYLLLADRDAQGISQAIHPDDEHHYPHTDDVRRYVAEGRPLRCIRIHLAPGQGYIAPTELIPHDGSTEGQPLPSKAAFWLGHWPRATYT
ncbi:hypothetical protein [Streptomyces sp. YGL11-2]|uniref:hypothetical protein n=1 Tax=Streptomyces sp. YGL11-2 TaxID=3414028 RepID=UPI003CECD7D8